MGTLLLDMKKWIFEPGHTAAEFRVKHMMVTFVRGLICKAEGTVAFDPDEPGDLAVDAKLDLKNLWTGEKSRDEHLLHEDFLHAEKYPHITFKSTGSEQCGASNYNLSGDLTIRGVTKNVAMAVTYLGKWLTDYYPEEGEPFKVMRAGFTAELTINRLDFGVNWNSPMEKGGLVVGTEVFIKLDAEALLM